jgi:hypothetical protein
MTTRKERKRVNKERQLFLRQGFFSKVTKKVKLLFVQSATQKI